MATCVHQAATQETNAACSGHSCTHKEPELTLRDDATGKVYKIAPEKKQKNRVRLINMLFGHATMMAAMPFMLVEEVTGITGPDFSGLAFSTAYQAPAAYAVKRLRLRAGLCPARAAT